MDSEKYSPFLVSGLAYKVVNNQDIKVYVLTPKNITPGKHPVVVKFHGGFFVSGASLYTDWYPQWALDYCLLHSAIIVTGDYRLLPESTGADIYEDLRDFWSWVRNGLQDLLDKTLPGVEADLSKVLVHGESAGGSLSLISGFLQPNGSIKAVISMYPAINLSPKRSKPIVGAPTLPPSVLENHLKSMIPGAIVTSANPPERMDIALSMAQQGTLQRFFGDDERVDVKKLLEKANYMPYTLILHGDEDSAVPIADNIEWTEAAKKKFGDNSIDLYVEPGGEHGFDCAVPLGTPWLSERLAKITELWLDTKEQ